MGHIVWFTREYIARNGVCDKVKYPVSLDGEPPFPRADRETRRTLRRAEKNATEAKVEASRLANNNFRAGRDLLLTATLSPEAMARLGKKLGATQAEDPNAYLLRLRAELRNWVRRARKRLPEGTELRYMAWASDLDGKTGALVAPHLHVIVNAEAAEAMEASWDRGHVFAKTLRGPHHGDLTDLVEYLMRQARRVGAEKRYTPSRNLDKPCVTPARQARNPDARLRVPKGASLIYASEQRAGRPQKLRYYRPERDAGRLPDEGSVDGG